MRWMPLVVLTLGLALGQALPLVAQDKKTHTQLTEVAGRSLEYWISEIKSPDPSKRENAIRAVLLFGPERAYAAVPVILDQLRKHSAANPVDASVRVNGAIALGIILADEHAADSKTSFNAADPKIIGDAVAILKRFLGDNQQIVKFRAAQALGRIGPAAKSALPEVISVAKDPATWETRQAAAIALGQIARDRVSGPPIAVLNALYGRLGDNSVQVRLAAIQALTFLGGPTNDALRTGLVRALDAVASKDAEPTVRVWAHMAVMSVTGSKDRIPAVAQVLTHPDMAAKVQAIQALGILGKEAKSAIPALIKTLQDPEPGVVVWGMWALGRMESAARGALPVLEQIKIDTAQPEFVRKMAEGVIDEILGKKK